MMTSMRSIRIDAYHRWARGPVMYSMQHIYLILAIIVVGMEPTNAVPPDQRFTKLKELVNEKYDTVRQEQRYSIRVTSPDAIDIYRTTSEIKNTPFYVDDRPARHSGLVRRLDRHGKVVSTTPLPDAFARSIVFGNSAQSTVRLPDDRWLLLAPQRGDAPTGVFYTFVFDVAGTVVEVDSTVDIGTWGSAPQLVTDGKGNVRAVGCENGLYLQNVKPSLGSKAMLIDNLRNLKGLSIDNYTAFQVNDDNILICCRPSGGTKGNKGWRVTEIGYMVVGIDGIVRKNVRKLDYVAKAFRKVSNAYLPGIIADDYLGYVQLNQCIDICRSNDGSAVLSVTAYDESNALCIYQVKFDGQGEVVTPRCRLDITPTALSGRGFPATTHTGVVTFLSVKKSSEERMLKQVFWGLDDKGNFCWESIALEGKWQQRVR